MLPSIVALTPNPAVPPSDNTFWPSDCVDSIFYATSLSRPSDHPQFIVASVFDEADRDCLITGLTYGVLFGVCLELVRLYPDNTLLHILDDAI